MDISKFRILVVDDEQSVRRNIEKLLLRAGYTVRTACDSEEALQELDEHSFDLVILDIVMPDWTGQLSNRAGVDLLKQIVEEHPQMPVIMLTATTTVELAVESMKYGAYDYILKGSISGQDFRRKVQEALGIEESVDASNGASNSPRSNSQTARSSGIGEWLITRSSGILDEIIAGLILTGAFYTFGRLSGHLSGTPVTWLRNSSAIWYLITSVTSVSMVIIGYIIWQRKQ